MINGINTGFYGNPFSDYSPLAGSFGAPVDRVGGAEEVKKPILSPGESTKVIGAHKSPPAECQT